MIDEQMIGYIVREYVRGVVDDYLSGHINGHDAQFGLYKLRGFLTLMYLSESKCQFQHRETDEELHRLVKRIGYQQRKDMQIDWIWNIFFKPKRSQRKRFIHLVLLFDVTGFTAAREKSREFYQNLERNINDD